MPEGRAWDRARRASLFGLVEMPDQEEAPNFEMSCVRVLRKATRFNAPRGSPAASARAAAVISESIQIPPQLSLPSFDALAAIYRTSDRERSERAKEKPR
jgi:hypothetical protein